MTYHSGGHTELQKLPAKASSQVTVSYVKSTKPIPPNFLPAGYAKAQQPAYLKTALRIPHLFVGQLVLFVHTYHICNKHVIYYATSTLVHFGSCLV